MCGVLRTKGGFSTSLSTLFVEIGATGQNFHNARVFGWHERAFYEICSMTNQKTSR